MKLNKQQKIILISIISGLGLILIWRWPEQSQVELNTETEATEIVRSLPEVQEWLNLFSESDGTSPITGGKPIIEISDIEEDIYTIHVYESMSTHNATFNWYEVNAKTKEVTPMFEKNHEDSESSP